MIVIDVDQFICVFEAKLNQLFFLFTHNFHHFQDSTGSVDRHLNITRKMENLTQAMKLSLLLMIQTKLDRFNGSKEM